MKDVIQMGSVGNFILLSVGKTTLNFTGIKTRYFGE
jgi:hypothetical protein